MVKVSDKAFLYRLLNDAGVSFSVGDFDSRMRLQKAAYLLRAMGAPLDYSYNWYMRGPYSPGLTATLFEIASHKKTVAEEATTVSIGPKAQAKIDNLARVLKDKPSSVPTLARWYELLASTAYLVRAGKSESSIRKQMLLEKNFSSSDVDRALDDLRRLGICK